MTCEPKKPAKIIIPRASGEGGLGLGHITWGAAYFDSGQFSNIYIKDDLLLKGNLQLWGDIDKVGSDGFVAKDKNLILDNSSTGVSGDYADGGGLIVKGIPDKSILWLASNNSWNFSHSINTSGSCFVDKDLVTEGNSYLVSNSFVGKNFHVSGNSLTDGDLVTEGDSYLVSDTFVGKNFHVSGNSLTDGDLVTEGDSYLVSNAFIGKNLEVSGDILIGGNAIIEGESLILEAEILKIEDKNIELGVSSTGTSSDITADGGGITLHGDTLKTISWSNATDSWDISEHLGIADGKYIFADKLRARDAAGLSLEDDGGNGIFIQDGGFIGIGTTNPSVGLEINHTDALKIPKGTTAQRPTSNVEGHKGYIRYNTTTDQFEGFGAGNAWGSLGGVIDVDQDTYVSAENSAGEDNDQLKFFTSGVQRAIIDSAGNIGVGTASPSVRLDLLDSTNVVTGGSDPVALRIGHSNQDGGANSYNTNADVCQLQFYSADASASGGIGAVRASVGLVSEGAAGAGFALTLRTDAGNEKMRIASGGNVGIGVNSDLHSQLTIGDSSSLTNGAYLSLRNNNSDGGARLATFGYVTNAITIGTRNESTGAHNAALASFSYSSIHFSTGSSNANITPRMVINTNGNVGIGTTNPAEKLDLNGILRIENTSAPSSTANKLYSVGGHLYWNGGIVHNSTSPSPQSSVNNSGRTYIQDISIDAYGHITGISSATETVVNTNTTYSAGTALILSGTQFNVSPNLMFGSVPTIGHSLGKIEVGNVNGIRFFSWDGVVGTNETMRLKTNGDLLVEGDVIASSSTLSDEKLKDDVKQIKSGLKKVKQLRGVEFNWNATNQKGNKDIGVIAQEVETIIPEVVSEKVPCLGEFSENTQAYKTVDYARLTPVLIEAIKELSYQVDSLSKELDKLKNK